MRYGLLSFTALTIALAGCRATGGGGMMQQQAEVKSWGGPEDLQAARQLYVDAVIKCSPMILALVPGDGKIDLMEAGKHAVIEQFVTRMVQEPKTPFDFAARLSKYHDSDKAAGGQLPPCGGEAVEYLVFHFAGRTNVLSLKANPTGELKILY